MYCNNCGTELNEDADFCWNCGASAQKLDQEQPKEPECVASREGKPTRPKKKALRIIGAAMVLLVVIVICVVAFSPRKLKMLKRYDSEGKLTQCTKYSYYLSGECKEKLIYDEEDELEYRTVYEYKTEEGARVEYSKSYYGDGELMSQTEGYFDTEGKRVKSITTSNRAETVSTYRYNEDGRIRAVEVETDYSDGTGHNTVTKYTYEMDEKGNVEKRTETFDGDIVEVHYYDNDGNVVKIEYYGWFNEISGYKVIEYDSRGNETEARYYSVEDGVAELKWYYEYIY